MSETLTRQGGQCTVIAMSFADYAQLVPANVNLRGEKSWHPSRAVPVT